MGSLRGVSRKWASTVLEVGFHFHVVATHARPQISTDVLLRNPAECGIKSGKRETAQICAVLFAGCGCVPPRVARETSAHDSKDVLDVWAPANKNSAMRAWGAL